MFRKKTKILILGSTGMLAYMAAKVLRRNKSFYVDATHLDSKKKEFYFNVLLRDGALKGILQSKGPYDYIINCIGITKNNIDEHDKNSVKETIKINGLFPFKLSLLAERFNVRVINISTDGVFASDSGICKENKKPDAKDIYGLSKKQGEVKFSNVLNIRTSIIGPSPYEKKGLYEWFISQSEGGEISGFVNHFWNGATTLQFAILCEKIIINKKFDALRDVSHVYHFAPNSTVSKYELLCFLKIFLKKNIIIKPVKDEKKTVNRLLRTKFSGIKKIFSHRRPMGKAIQQLINFIN